jgi:hypothetical protein
MSEPVKTPQISQIEVLKIAQVYRINVTTNAEYCSCGNSYKAVS